MRHMRVGEPRHKRYYWNSEPSPFVDNHIAKLLQKEKDGTITPEEKAGLDQLRNRR
jgi:hypothetical protein